MGKYLQAMQGSGPDEKENLSSPVKEGKRAAVPIPAAPPATSGVVAVPPSWTVPHWVFEARALWSITERLAPLAAVGQTKRLLVGGCAEGDGASTIAAALAFDMSERLSLRTLLFDAHLRRPILDQMFTGLSRQPVAVLIDGAVQVRQTRWPRLFVASCCQRPNELDSARLNADLEKLSGRYEAAVIDIGVPRLDPRSLSLARPDDPILLVVRYGHTERRDLETTTAALQAAGRSIAGVVFNAKAEVMSGRLRRFINHE